MYDDTNDEMYDDSTLGFINYALSVLANRYVLNVKENVVVIKSS